MARSGIVKRYPNGEVTVGWRPDVCIHRCGASAGKPYCDGSHGRVGYEG